MYCQNCGLENLDSARFCKSCGGDLSARRPAIQKSLVRWGSKKIVLYAVGLILVVGIVGFFIEKGRHMDGGLGMAQNSSNPTQPAKAVTFKTRTVSQKFKNSYGVTTSVDLELPKLEGTYDGIPEINTYYDKIEKELVFMYEGDEVEKNFLVKANFRKETVINDIISISGDGDRGVTGSIKIYGDVFDLNTGKKLMLDDVFNVSSDKYLALIYKNVSNSIKEEMAKEMEKTGDSRYNYSLKDINSVSAKKEINAFDPKDFFLTDKSLVVFYPQGSFGCNGCGEFKYEIPFESIKDLLKIKFPADQSIKASKEKAPETDNANNDLHTYTNDIYKYRFNYPDGATIKEARKGEFGLTYEASKKGLTLENAYKKYTGKICLSVIYKDGAVIISTPENEENQFILCSGRTGIGSQSKTVSAKEDISIDGKTYTVDTRDITDDGKHNYLVWIKLEDGTRITISTASLETKATLKKVVESYISTN